MEVCEIMLRADDILARDSVAPGALIEMMHLQIELLAAIYTKLDQIETDTTSIDCKTPETR